MVWLTLLLGMAQGGTSVSPSDPVVETVPISAELFGARYRTRLALPAEPEPFIATSSALLQHNAERLVGLKTWVDNSTERFDFGDFGRIQLVVSSIDALGLDVVEQGLGTYQPIGAALERGQWTRDDRLLAIGGGLMSLGYSVALFEHPQEGLFLGLGTQDPDLNVDSIRQNWTLTRGDQVRTVFVEWILWDGVGRLGDLKSSEDAYRLAELKQLEPGPPTGEYFSFIERKLPPFTLRKPRRIALPVVGSSRHLSLTHHPHLADWLSRYPQFKFERHIDFVEQEMALLQLGPSVRRLAAGGVEEEVINQLLRTFQTQFTYTEGPLSSMDEIIQSGRADCDQLAMLMLISLRTLGYQDHDVISVRWPGHLALGVRPKQSTPDGFAIHLDEGRYVILDTTNYLYSDNVLVSRWGALADKYGREARVGLLVDRKADSPLTH